MIYYNLDAKAPFFTENLPIGDLKLMSPYLKKAL